MGYRDIIGIPSGEVFSLPQNIINKLRKEGLIYKDTFNDGEHNIISYVFDDYFYDDIIGCLSDSDDW